MVGASGFEPPTPSPPESKQRRAAAPVASQAVRIGRKINKIGWEARAAVTCGDARSGGRGVAGRFAPD